MGADATVAEHDLGEVCRGACHLGGTLHQSLRRECGERCELARLPDDRIAADECERRVPAPYGDRKVERGDDADRTDRVPGLHQPMAGTL